MERFDAAAAQRAKHLSLDPRLYRFTHLGRAAAEVQNGRQTLGRERVERAAEPAGCGFEHRELDRTPERDTMPQSAITAKQRSASSGLLERYTRSKALFDKV